MIAKGSSLQELMGPRRGKINPAKEMARCSKGFGPGQAAVT
jgi:hypothetical protein